MTSRWTGLRTAGDRLRILIIVAIAAWVSPAGAASDQSFAAFLDGLWVDASRPPFSVSRRTFDSAFDGVEPDLKLPDLVVDGRGTAGVSGQAEFMRSPQEYISRTQIIRLAGTGRRLQKVYAAALGQIEQRYGVDGSIVLAIWGRETAFGAYRPSHDAIRVLATQAWVGRRKELFRSELLHALRLIEEGVIKRAEMKSSWAGAMGLTQFMPSEFFSSREDLDGGTADLFASVPDALASAARQLQQKGWVSGLPWGFEVTLPDGADCTLEGPTQARSISQWAKLGFAAADKISMDRNPDVEAYLMAPAGAKGPIFLVTENYKVIRRYNMSDLYATFVGHLADRISGGGDFRQRWSTDAVALRESSVADIQLALKGLGYEVEKVDGKVGSNTRLQIGLFQKATGNLEVDCWPSERLLQALRAHRSSALKRPRG